MPNPPRIVIVSDVHIGDNSPTNWYQRTLHEHYFVTFFDWVAQQASSIDELIILGDLVDQWTYLPSVRPPSFAAITAANPGIFGDAQNPGALIRALTALEGRVTYLNGNHDMAVTAADLATLNDAQGRTIRLIPTLTYQPEAAAGKLVVTHGHMYSMFNAPDPISYPTTKLPVGHFVTRLAALHAIKLLGPNQTVADLPASGDPSGWGLVREELSTALQDFLTGDESLAGLMLGALVEACGEKSTLPVILADGSSVTIAEAITAYAGLYYRWSKEDVYDRATYGRDPGASALLGTDVRNDLSHFALVLGARFPMVVMGHTHAPAERSGHLLLRADSLYANTGFACPSRADMHNPDRSRQQFPSFVDLTIDAAGHTGTANIRYITGDENSARIAPEPLTPSLSVPLN